MMRTIGMVAAVAAVWLVSAPAHAFTLGEVTATTGVQGTLAKSGTTSAAGTMASVKGALNRAVATKEGQLAGAGGGQPPSWGGKGGTGGWASAGAGGGWATAGGAGWATASAGGGWATGHGGAWATGGWGSGH
jgi:hypothetical protein